MIRDEAWDALIGLSQFPAIITIAGEEEGPARRVKIYWADGTAIHIHTVKRLPWKKKEPIDVELGDAED